MEIIGPDGEETVRLKFSHRTEYRYSGPVSFGKHRLVLRPRESHFERIERMNISTTPECSIQWYQDIYGNIIANVEFADDAEMLVIQSEFVMAKNFPVLSAEESALDPGEEYPVYYAGIEESASHLYRGSIYPPEVESIRSWIRSLNCLPVSGNRAPIFLSLARFIHEQVSYLRRENPGVRTPMETLGKKSGSCRDTAVLMMEAGRCIGFATRFVSGYLESGNSRVGRGSTHAWMEVYLPDRGWVGYDPSIGEAVGIDHVAVAVSHHPRGVMPITGKFESFGNVSRGMTVAIHSEKY